MGRTFKYPVLFRDKQNKDYGKGLSGLFNAMSFKTNEEYKEKVNTDFKVWQDFKIKNKDNMYSDTHIIKVDKEQEDGIQSWLKGKEVSINFSLKVILESYKGKIYPTKEEIIKRVKK